MPLPGLLLRLGRRRCLGRRDAPGEPVTDLAEACAAIAARLPVARELIAEPDADGTTLSVREVVA